MTDADRPVPEDLAVLLSARLDGELDAEEARQVDDALDRDAAAVAELDELARVRDALRGLPAVEPPAGFYAGLLAEGGADDQVAAAAARPGRRRGLRVGAVVAAVAAAVVVVAALAVGLVGDDDGEPMVPAVAQLVARHDAVAMAGGPAPVDDGFEPMSADELDAMEGPMAAPPSLPGSFARVAGYHDEGGTMHLVYDADGMVVSVYAQPGRVDFGALPGEGERMDLDGDEAWMDPDVPVDGRGVEVLVLQRGDTAYTFVADAPHDQVMAVVEGMAAATAA